ncbi:MAG: TM0106 family RecB-like putative nuclease [Syntrophales bacterium]|nr:TM0106 family RecB-like putative nuclease [Syntrophales bacterium]
MSKPITASILYNLVQCPHRVSMDLFGDPALRDPINPFVQLLWERGNAFEQEVIEGLKLPFTNLHTYYGDEKERFTMEAMECGDNLIYSGRISADGLVGEPDILRRCGNGYIAGDIKSGEGEEGGSEDIDGKPKKHYAVQLALYTDILERSGFSGGRIPFVWDVHGKEVEYILDAPRSSRKPATLWDEYQSILETARQLVVQTGDSLPAFGSRCKLCHWYTACTNRLEELDDLTLIPELGRVRQDNILTYVDSVRDLAQANLETLINGKKTIIPRIGADMLIKFQERARLQKQPGARPYLKEVFNPPDSDFELFFDVETDPMRDICYLHGFVERHGGDNGTERYIAFLAEEPTSEEEESAFGEAWAYVKDCRPCAVYYYAAYERTIWRKLQKRYPHVATEEEIEEMFEPATAVDLYHHVVRPKTEWPTRDYSLKTLASCLGFKWRDVNPSGAASIEWYHRWVEGGDTEIRQRILDYNEDDCVAMRVLLDGIRGLSLR